MVSWSPPPWPTEGLAGADQRSPDLSDIIQVIINRPGWERGNALALVITGSGRRVADSHNGNSEGVALLHVEYEN